MENLLICINQDIKKISGDLPLNVSAPFLEQILKPYKKNATYLKSAQITNFAETVNHKSKEPVNLLTAVGRFSIEESCYIDDTGHFNSVEFNICYNQLAYAMFGKAIEVGIYEKIIPNTTNRIDLPFDTFLKYQLSSMFIAKIEGKFLKPLKGIDFGGELSIYRVASIGKTMFAYTNISFFDEEGIKAKGLVLLAFNPSTNQEHDQKH